MKRKYQGRGCFTLLQLNCVPFVAALVTTVAVLEKSLPDTTDLLSGRTCAKSILSLDRLRLDLQDLEAA